MPDVVISNEGPVRRIRMNRPDKKNALTLAMYEAMAAAIEEANTADGVRCVLIAGAPDVFCAGNRPQRFRHDGTKRRARRAHHPFPACARPLPEADGRGR